MPREVVSPVAGQAAAARSAPQGALELSDEFHPSLPRGVIEVARPERHKRGETPAALWASAEASSWVG